MRAQTLPSLRLEIDQPEILLPTSIFGSTLAVFLVVVVGLGAVAAWSATAPIASGAVAQGHVIVESRRKTIQHLEGGIVGDILVKEGSFVAPQQVLIRLDDTRLQLSYAILRDKSDQNAALIARLASERDGQPGILFSARLIERADTEPALAAILDAQRRQLETRRKSEQGKVDLLRQRIGELNEQISGFAAQVKSKTGQLALIEDELAGTKELYSKGLVPKPRVLALERASEDLSGGRAQIASQIAGAKVAIEEAEMQILQNARSFQEDVVEKLRQVTADEVDTDDRMAAMREAMERLNIRSPIAGQVVGLAVHTAGGVIAPGEKLMDIVPGADRLVIDAQVPPNEIDHVHLGLPAEIQLTALRQRTTPTLQGKVVSISTDVLSDPATHQDYYTARIEIAKSEISRLGEAKLVAGMPAEVLIKSGERTVLAYIIAPIRDAIFRSFHQD